VNSPYYEKGWRLGVGIVLLNSKKEIFMGERLDNKGAWQMPQGGVKIGKNEDLNEAATRELYEETGVKNAKLVSKSKEWHYYELPKPLANKLWRGKFIGQKQKWFLFHFLGQDSEINIRYNSRPEFNDWKWVDPKEVSNEIVNFKKEIYKKVLLEFGVLLN
jgi:putative (di)nucleoside polyphosphate hydrolase